MRLLRSTNMNYLCGRNHLDCCHAVMTHILDGYYSTNVCVMDDDLTSTLATGSQNRLEMSSRAIECTLPFPCHRYTVLFRTPCNILTRCDNDQKRGYLIRSRAGSICRYLAGVCILWLDRGRNACPCVSNSFNLTTTSRNSWRLLSG